MLFKQIISGICSRIKAIQTSHFSLFRMCMSAPFYLRFWQMQTTNGSKSTIEINNLFPQSSYAIQVSGVIKEGQQYLETKTGRVNCSTG